MWTRIPIAVLLGAFLAIPMYAQINAPNPTQRGVPETRDSVAVYRVTVVARTTPAVNYRHRDKTTIDFRGTPLLPQARGKAQIDSERGYTEIDVELDELSPATQFGPEYLTYVMWAITPEGRATNLGEVVLNGSDGELEVTTELQTFALIVTAEPYFAVTQPSDVVVMENVVRPDTEGRIEPVVAKYDLLTRGTYLMNRDPATLSRGSVKARSPLDLLEARNAVQLARFAGADEHATETFQKASRLLADAEDQYGRKRSSRTVSTTAREAVQVAEDARLIALKRVEERRLALEREAAARREADARTQAALEAERRARADTERRAAEDARAEAELAAQRARAEADLAAQRARAEAEQAALRTERQIAETAAAREAAERAKAEADLAAQRLAQEKAAAEAARLASQAEADRARQAAEQARQVADAAEKEKAELRARLQEQLNIILETRQTARGLIVNMSDVLFDTAKHTLRPGAREKLAKVAGILMTYPDLTLEIEGHTDSVGSDEYNNALSERRAATVRDFLVQQGMQRTAISARGLGESQPVVTNQTAAGRQQNRRVELVVSGEALGVPKLSRN